MLTERKRPGPSANGNRAHIKSSPYVDSLAGRPVQDVLPGLPLFDWAVTAAAQRREPSAADLRPCAPSLPYPARRLAERFRLAPRRAVLVAGLAGFKGE